MKGINFSFLRIISALIIGLILVLFPDRAGEYFIITIAVIFMIPSLISIISYLVQPAEARHRFPVEGLGSLLLGGASHCYVRLLCQFCDDSVGLYPRHGRRAADNVAPPGTALDACTLCILRCSVADTDRWNRGDAQSYGCAENCLHHYRYQQLGICRFRTDKLEQVCPSPS